MESTSSSSSDCYNSNTDSNMSTSNSLELRLMYCKDLRAFNFFQKLTVYALVSIVDTGRINSDVNKTAAPDGGRQQHRTPTDKQGNRNPEWNHSIILDLNPIIASNNNFNHDDNGNSSSSSSMWFLHFVLRHEGGGLFGDKTIGEVSVPLKGLLEESRGIVRCLSYQVRTTSSTAAASATCRGKPNGVLAFSCKFNDQYCSYNSSVSINTTANSSQNQPQEIIRSTQLVAELDDSLPIINNKQLHDDQDDDDDRRRRHGIRYPPIIHLVQEEEIRISYPILDLQTDDELLILASKEVKLAEAKEDRPMIHDDRLRHRDRPYGGGYNYSRYPPPPPVYHPHPGVATHVGCYCDCPYEHQPRHYCSGGRQGNQRWRPATFGRH